MKRLYKSFCEVFSWAQLGSFNIRLGSSIVFSLVGQEFPISQGNACFHIFIYLLDFFSVDQ